MSIRAYRVISKELAENCSFNLWHDNDLIKFFNNNNKGNYSYFEMSESDNGSGNCDINVALLEKAVEQFKWKKDDYRLFPIKDDIQWAKDNNTEWVNYEFF